MPETAGARGAERISRLGKEGNERVEALGHDGVWVGWRRGGRSRSPRLHNREPHVARDVGDLGPHPAAPEDGPVRHDRATLNPDVTDVCVGARSAKLSGPLYAVEFEVAGVPYHQRDDVDEQILLLRHLRTRPAKPYRREFHASRTAVWRRPGYWHPRGAVLRASSPNSAEVERRQRENPGGRDHLVDEDVAPIGSSLLEAGGRPVVDARNAGPPQPARVPGRVRER